MFNAKSFASVIPKLSLPKLEAQPKLKSLQIHRLSNGFQVNHQFSSGKAKQFVFHNPQKMVQHIRHIQKSDWLHPNLDRDASRIEKTLNL